MAVATATTTTGRTGPAEVFPVTEFIKEELEERGWSQADLANIIGKSPRDVHVLVSGKVPLRPEMATLLGEAFGTSAEYWMSLETAYRSWMTGRETKDAVASRGRLYELAPVREMQKRGWIRSTNDAEILEGEIAKFFGVSDLEALKAAPMPLAARMAIDYNAGVSPALRAWATRARSLAHGVGVARPYAASRFPECIDRLRALLANAEEARHVPRVLSECGIRFLVVEHLPQTKLDGGCFWLDSHSPVVALTMRYERLDWFWFTLMHEMGHVLNRDGLRSADPVLDVSLVGQDAESRDAKPASERAADEFAEAALVPVAQMEDFIARVGPLYSRDRIRLFAKRLQVHPAIVVGQLRFRKQIPFTHSGEVMRDKLRGIITENALTDGWGFSPLSV